MENIKSYESFSTVEIKESNDMNECGMSPASKMALESLCEAMLCKEADQYHNDENPEHTYEGYVNECANYIKECMGQSGYAPLIKADN
jgi:hypothetical protein